MWNAFRLTNGTRNEKLKTRVSGVALPTPIGMAAGFDKDCNVLRSLLNLGFGFVTGGTITLASRPGNPKPRVIRLTNEKALINSMGFPGRGLEPAIKRLQRSQRVKERIFVSIAGTIEDEIFDCLHRVQSLAAGIELNISSPNTAGLRIFHETGRLRGLIEALAAEKNVPLFVKLPPWSRGDDDRREILKLAETAINSGADGLIVANTRPIESNRLKVGRGGLSGEPLFENTELMIADVQAMTHGNVGIIACGGVSTSTQVWKLLASGASAVQLYTSFIYEGPGLPARLNKGLAKLMATAGITSIDEISGAPPTVK